MVGMGRQSSVTSRSSASAVRGIGGASTSLLLSRPTRQSVAEYIHDLTTKFGIRDAQTLAHHSADPARGALTDNNARGVHAVAMARLSDAGRSHCHPRRRDLRFRAMASRGNNHRVTLPPKLDAFVQAKIRSGRYESVSEVVRESLRLLEERDQQRRADLADVREKIRIGCAQIEAGDTFDGDEVFAEIQALSRARRRSAKSA